MKREIKFRAWSNGHQISCLGYTGLIYLSHPWHQRMFSWEEIIEADYILKALNSNDSDKYQFMQYTGLKDKNGKEIYEGDVVRYFENSAEGEVGVIEYYKHGFVICFKNGRYEDNWFEDAVEVIGNIYENQELL